MRLFQLAFTVLACVVSLAYADVHDHSHMEQHRHVNRDSTRYVFAHFMVSSSDQPIKIMLTVFRSGLLAIEQVLQIMMPTCSVLRPWALTHLP